MRILGFVLVAVALLTASCTSSDSDGTDPKATAHAKPVTPIDPAKAAVLKLGDDLPLVAKLPTRIDDQDATFLGVASGEVVFGTLTKPAKAHTKTQSHPILYNIRSQSVVRLDDGFQRLATTQLLGMASSQATIVWIEAPEAGATDTEVTVYTYERTSGARRARALNPVPGSSLVYGSDLTIANSRILFSMASADQKTGDGAAIYSGSISSGKALKPLVEDGQRLSVDGDQMTYSVGKAMFVRNLDSGDTKPVAVSSHANDTSFCGDRTVGVFTVLCLGSSVGGGAELTVKDPEGHATKVGPFAGAAPNDLRLIGPWIDIGSTDGVNRGQEYLLNPGSQKLEALPKGTSLESGNHPELVPDLTLLTQSGSPGQQWLVHIPST